MFNCPWSEIFFIQLEPPISVLYRCLFLSPCTSVKSLVCSLGHVLWSIGILLSGTSSPHHNFFPVGWKSPVPLSSPYRSCAPDTDIFMAEIPKLINNFLMAEDPRLGVVFPVWSNESLVKENPQSAWFPQSIGCGFVTVQDSVHQPPVPRMLRAFAAGQFHRQPVPCRCRCREVGSSHVRDLAFVLFGFHEIPVHSLSWKNAESIKTVSQVDTHLRFILLETYNFVR